MMNEENRLHIEELEKVSGGADKDGRSTVTHYCPYCRCSHAMYRLTGVGGKIVPYDNRNVPATMYACMERGSGFYEVETKMQHCYVYLDEEYNPID